jgi:1-acyl-sn-glycerol-3-phosphate acyltransferase
MFIGIGTLIFAKHPALRSLAAVTIIGMFTVVLMAYYLPPLVFRWLTRGVRTADPSSLTSHVSSPLPITLGRFLRSLFSIVFFLLMMYLFMLPFTWLYFHIGKNTEEKKLRYHRLLQKVSDFVIHRVPGVKFHLENRVGETFEKPAVIICNHQSHLDLMCLMMLTPRIVFLTNDWVWHNPFYGMVIHRAEFYPVSDGIENHIDQLKSLYNRGYSIAVFPEGTRSVDCSIQRFHKGAFYLAEQLQADILPIILHGAGHVLPKKDFMLRQGRIDVEVHERIKLDDQRFSSYLLTRTKQMRAYYKEHYAAMCEQIETADYWRPYQKYIEKYQMRT